MLTELGTLLRKHPPPNLFVALADCRDLEKSVELRANNGPMLTVECHGQKFRTKFNYDNVTDVYDPDIPVCAFHVTQPLTQMLKLTLWYGEENAHAGMEIALQSLVINQNKSMRVSFGEANMRLIFRATAEPFQRTLQEATAKVNRKGLSASALAALESPIDEASHHLLSTSTLPPYLTVNGDLTLDFTDENVQRLFNHFDRNGDGYISKSEFKQLFSSFENYGHMEEEKEVDEMLRKFKALGDDVLSYDEFRILMLKVSQR
jgi:hypothetical protein